MGVVGTKPIAHSDQVTVRHDRLKRGQAGGARCAAVLLAAIAAVLLACEARAATLVFGPRVEFPTPDTAIVGWTTDSATRGRVRFGTEAGKFTQHREDGVTNQHRVTLQGLQAGVRYYFVAGIARQGLATNSFIAGGGAETEVSHSTPPATKKAGENPQRQLAQVKAPAKARRQRRGQAG